MKENRSFNKTKLNIFINDDGLPLNRIVGKAVAILGVRGSGKTNTSAVLVEELLLKGVPSIILDVDGEYWTLREKYDILLVSSDKGKADININIKNKNQAIKLAKALLEAYVPAVIDLSEYIIDEYSEYLVAFLEEIWKVSKLYRKPLFLVLEEAHEFIPQGSSTTTKPILVRIALRGRKRGLGLIMVSQRSAKVDKDVLTQAEYYILHKVIHPADLRVYKELLPLDPKEVEAIVPRLEVGEALFYDGLNIKKVRIRKRYTYHVGYTPITSSERSFQLRKIDKSILDHVLSLIDIKSNNLVDFENINNKDILKKENKLIDKNGLMNKCIREDACLRALDNIVNLIYIFSHFPRSVIAQMYILAKENRWLSYSELKELSGFKTINSKKIITFLCSVNGT